MLCRNSSVILSLVRVSHQLRHFLYSLRCGKTDIRYSIRYHVILKGLLELGKNYFNATLPLVYVTQVETFLESFHWKSRSEGYRNSDTDQGNHVSSFVVKDYMSRKNAMGYYIAARPSTKDCGRIICHLEPIGAIKDVIRRTGLVPAKGEKKLSDWVSNNFIHAQMLLFD